MENAHETQTRMRVRDAGLRLLNRLTTSIAVLGFALVGIFGALSAATIPGKSTSSSDTSTASAANPTSSSASATASSSSSSSSSSSLQPSSGVSSAPSGSGTAVSGGS